jgi:F0F1-type ATP synthase assembly protein I
MVDGARLYARPMAFDWRKLERDERRAHDRVALTLGVVFTIGGVVGVVLNVVVGRATLATGSVVWLLFGIGTLWVGVRARRRGRLASDEQRDRSEDRDDRTDGVQPPPA